MRGNGGNELKERRKYRRFEVSDTIFAVLKPEMKKLGLVRDISEAGLSLEYISNSDMGEHFTELDIFSYPHHFSMTRLPCSIVHDSIYRDQQDHEFDCLRIRLCGLKFGKLQAIQKEELKKLLKNGI